MENEFENYRTESFSFIVPELSDSISPRIQECSISNSIIDIWFSEPLDPFDPNNLFYFYDNPDSNQIYFDILNFDPKRGTITISSNQANLENLNIGINWGMIKDLSGNIISDTAIPVWLFCTEIAPLLINISAVVWGFRLATSR